jgi:hypothetical protein
MRGCKPLAHVAKWVLAKDFEIVGYNLFIDRGHAIDGASNSARPDL